MKRYTVWSLAFILTVVGACSSGSGSPPDAGPDGSEDAFDAGADLSSQDGGDSGSDAVSDQPGDPGGDVGGDQGALYVVEEAEDFDDPVLRASIFFSPIDDMESRILDELSRVEESVHLAFFNIRLQEVADSLLELHQAGKEVKILMDQKQMNQSYNTLDDWMADQGLDVTGILNESAADATMHNKFAIIDGRRVLTGSLNYSTTALNRSEEDVLVIDDAEIAGLYEEEFLELASGEDVPRVEDPQAPLQVYFGPEDRLDLMTIAAIESAQTSIQVIMFSAGTASITEAIEGAIDRGVNVVFLIDQRQSQDTDMDETIESAGAHVLRVERSFPVELHDKLCVVDGTLLLAGSYNWTPLASFHNDENYVRLVSEGLSARVMGRVVQIVRQESSSFDPAAFGWTTGQRSVTFTVTNLRIRSDAACYVVGSVPQMGSMDASQALAMSRADGPLGEIWSVTVELPAGEKVDYKYLVRGPDEVNHREGPEPRTVVVPYVQRDYLLFDTFRE